MFSFEDAWAFFPHGLPENYSLKLLLEWVVLWFLLEIVKFSFGNKLFSTYTSNHSEGHELMRDFGARKTLKIAHLLLLVTKEAEAIIPLPQNLISHKHWAR